MSTITTTSTGARFIYLAARAINPVTGEDVDQSAATFKMALVRPNDRPDVADWFDASSVGIGLIAGQSYHFVRALIGIGGVFEPKPAEYAAWIRIELGSEIVEEDCGRIRVL